jgi:hypothetical protein
VTYHSNECRLVYNPENPKRMGELNLIEQDYILNCPHKDHESIRMMFRRKQDK